MEATAFLGVVGWDKRVFYYELYPKSVNGDKFRLFLRNLRYKLGRQRVVIYMDNLRLHHSKATIPKPQNPKEMKNKTLHNPKILKIWK